MILEQAKLAADYTIPMILHCPECGERHIDEGEFAEVPHHTHSCGKISNIDVIEPRGGQIIAVQASGTASGSAPGREFILANPTPIQG